MAAAAAAAATVALCVHLFEPSSLSFLPLQLIGQQQQQQLMTMADDYVNGSSGEDDGNGGDGDGDGGDGGSDAAEHAEHDKDGSRAASR